MCRHQSDDEANDVYRLGAHFSRVGALACHAPFAYNLWSRSSSTECTQNIALASSDDVNRANEWTLKPLTASRRFPNELLTSTTKPITPKRTNMSTCVRVHKRPAKVVFDFVESYYI